MKVLALALILSLQVPQLQPPAKLTHAPAEQTTKRKGGRWYFAANGHAVYCYGPVMTMPQADGGFVKVATFCRGDQVMVPLKD
ncbi:MAG TPA: hypothetical protein VL983_08475 [Terriglobales bacterium]|nr:hypothetical protein [Terriglobales bacterium]